MKAIRSLFLWIKYLTLNIKAVTIKKYEEMKIILTCALNVEYTNQNRKNNRIMKLLKIKIKLISKTNKE